MNRILFVEDDQLFRESVAEFLEDEGFFVEEAASFEEALEASFKTVFDLYLLDINLGRKNGVELLKELRGFDEAKPILMLTSRNCPKTASECFETGCDDYIRKPCDPTELLARVKSKLRDSFGNKKSRLKLPGGVEFDLDKKNLKIDGKEIDLSPKELELLTLLLKNRNQTVSIELIEKELWPAAKEPSYASIRVYVNSLKKLLGKEIISNIKGVGYRLES